MAIGDGIIARQSTQLRGAINEALAAERRGDHGAALTHMDQAAGALLVLRGTIQRRYADQRADGETEGPARAHDGGDNDER